MRIIYVLLFLVTIVFSDVVSSTLTFGEHEVSMIDHTSESESENEKELEVEVEKEAQLDQKSGFSLDLLANRGLQRIPAFLSGKLRDPYQEIHCPPPDMK